MLSYNYIGKQLLLIVLFLVSFSQTPSQVKIMPLGDSITRGTNPDSPNDTIGYRESLYQQLFSAGYNIDFVGSQRGNTTDPNHEGHGGWEASHPGGSVSLLDTLPKFLTKNPPNIILLHIGTNDISSLSDFDWGTDLANEVIQILNTIYTFDSKIVTVVAKIIDRDDLSSRHQRTINFNDTLAIKVGLLPIKQKQNIRIVDMYDSLGIYYGTTNGYNPNFTYYTSGPNPALYRLHPNTTGYLKMANTWFPTVVGILPILQLRVFLQGPYTGNTMTTALRHFNDGSGTVDLLPTSSPFTSAPKSVSYTIPDTVTDWILLEIRNPDNSVKKLKSCLLSKHGYAIDPDGFSTSISLGITPGPYYIVVKQRNHLAVMSSSTVQLTGLTAYDFTTGSGQYNGGSIGAKDLGSGVWGMIAGDGNGNGQMQNDDSENIWKPDNGTSGYKNSDYNMNGQVQNDDNENYWKPNNGRGSQVP